MDTEQALALITTAAELLAEARDYLTTQDRERLTGFENYRLQTRASECIEAAEALQSWAYPYTVAETLARISERTPGQKSERGRNFSQNGAWPVYGDNHINAREKTLNRTRTDALGGPGRAAE